MKLLKQLLIGSDHHLEQKNMIWNMVGSAVYALTSMMLGAAVTRILGADLGGIFFFAFSTFGQQMFIVAYFGMRPIQITDVGNSHSFGDYFHFRCMTCLAACGIGILYTMIFVDSPLKKTVVFLMVLYKIVDGFADVYESEFQREGRLYLTGKSNTFRTLFSVTVFLGILIFTKNLVTAGVAAVAAQMAGVLAFDSMILKELGKADWSVHTDAVKQLTGISVWLFLSTFLDLYIFSASKYAIDAWMEPSASTYFGTIFIPTSVINLAAGFVIRPFLTVMSGCWEEQNYAGMWKVVARITGVIAVLTVLGTLAAWLLGIPVLAAMLGREAGGNLSVYKGALLINIIGGGFYAVLNLLYYVLVIMKNQKPIFIIYGTGCIAAAGLSPYMVRRYGIDGGAVSYLLLMIFLTGMFAGTVWKKYYAVKKKEQ